MSRKLAEKASLIQAPQDLGSESSRGIGRVEPSETRPKTAPGSMALFMASQSAAVKEAEELRDKLKDFAGAKPVRSLDPGSIRVSRWANRHEHSYSDAAFAELKEDIRTAGTNVQPISVRPLKGEGVLNGSTPEASHAFEVIFGHRRHRACLELGLPVQALVDEMDDQAMFQAMDRENRARKNLSAWEQGTMYKRALDEGLYPTQRRLAESLGVDVSLVSKSLSIARLPDLVVGAFPSPLDIQYRWAQPLAEALQKDPDGVLARASNLKRAGQGKTSAEVFAALVVPSPDSASQVLNGSTPERRVIEGQSGRRAVLARDSRGRVKLEFTPGSLSPASEGELAAFVQKLLSKKA